MKTFNPKGGEKAGKFRTAILLEHEEQVKDCLKRFKRIKGQKLILAVSPFAVYELDRLGLSYKVPEDYYSPKELYKLGLDNYKKVEAICEAIDREIQHAYPAIAELGIKPAFFSFRHLKNIYDAATIRLFQLSKLIRAEKPDALYHYGGKHYPFGVPGSSPYLFFDNRESIYANILACKGWDVSITRLPHIKQQWGNAPKEKAGVARWQYKYPELLDLILVAKRQGRQEALKIMRMSSPKNLKTIFLGAGYDWEDCRKELHSVGIDPVFIRILDNWEHWLRGSKEIDAGALHNAWRRLRSDDKFRKFFYWNGVNFFSTLEERIRFLVERLTPACLVAYRETTDLLQKKGAKALLFSAFFSCTGHSAAKAARDHGVPVVAWQEGSYGYFDHLMMPYNDLINSDVYFTYGFGVVDKYANAAKRYGAHLVSVGSPSLEALFRNRPSTKVKKIVKLDPDKKVVVYATTNFYQNTLYVITFPPFSDNSFWRTQREILNVLGKNDRYTSIVKIHPSQAYREPPMRAYAEEKKLKNCQFIRDECTFAELLPIADLFVIDYPTTTLLEALTTTKPVFVYTGHLRVDIRARKLLERRAFCYPDLKSFTGALENYLSGREIGRKVDLNDKKFLMAYGIGQGKGSALRGAKMCKRVIVAH